MTIQEMFAFGTGVVGLVSAVAMGLYANRNSASGIKNDIISTYEKRMKQMEDDIEIMKNELTKVSELLKKSEEDRKTAEMILQGRNPELDRYMTLTLKLLTEIHGAVMPQTVTP